MARESEGRVKLHLSAPSTKLEEMKDSELVPELGRLAVRLGQK